MAFQFNELDAATRASMLQQFDAEEASGNPYRSAGLSALGLAAWPGLMRDAITDPNGSEETLAAALNRDDYWEPTETYVRNGVARERNVNVEQASERLANTEFNTWYVAGLAHRLANEGVTKCRVYRAANPKWEQAECSVHEGQTYPVADIIAGHRIGYWPPPGVQDAFSIPAGPGCHHTIERV